MSFFNRIAENRIQAAIDRGELGNLVGQGKLNAPEHASVVPAALRAGYRLLKNAGFLPPQIAFRHELRQVERSLEQADSHGCEKTTCYKIKPT